MWPNCLRERPMADVVEFTSRTCPEILAAYVCRRRRPSSSSLRKAGDTQKKKAARAKSRSSHRQC
jgi:hypothetical protein